MTEPDPDGPLNPDAPELDLDVPVPGSPAETTADEEEVDAADKEADPADEQVDPDGGTPEPPD